MIENNGDKVFNVEKPPPIKRSKKPQKRISINYFERELQEIILQEHISNALFEQSRKNISGTLSLSLEAVNYSKNLRVLLYIAAFPHHMATVYQFSNTHKKTDQKSTWEQVRCIAARVTSIQASSTYNLMHGSRLAEIDSNKPMQYMCVRLHNQINALPQKGIMMTED